MHRLAYNTIADEGASEQNSVDQTMQLSFAILTNIIIILFIKVYHRTRQTYV